MPKPRPSSAYASKPAGDNVDLDVAWRNIGVKARTDQEDGREQIPLDFQKGVRADIQRPHDDVDGADDDGSEHQPEHGFANPLERPGINGIMKSLPASSASFIEKWVQILLCSVIHPFGSASVWIGGLSTNE